MFKNQAYSCLKILNLPDFRIAFIYSRDYYSVMGQSRIKKTELLISLYTQVSMMRLFSVLEIGPFLAHNVPTPLQQYRFLLPLNVQV